MYPCYPELIPSQLRWFEERRPFLSSKQIAVEMQGPTNEQTKKACTVQCSGPCFEADIFLWESGELDIMIADFSENPPTQGEFSLEGGTYCEIFALTNTASLTDLMVRLTDFLVQAFGRVY
jgi:hypothetical protein